MDNPIVEKKESPVGFGVAGMVMCPFGFQRSACLKNGCEMWTELKYGDNTVARCAIAWMPTVIVELRQEYEKLRTQYADQKTG